MSIITWNILFRTILKIVLSVFDITFCFRLLTPCKSVMVHILSAWRRRTRLHFILGFFFWLGGLRFWVASRSVSLLQLFLISIHFGKLVVFILFKKNFSLFFFFTVVCLLSVFWFFLIRSSVSPLAWIVFFLISKLKMCVSRVGTWYASFYLHN